MAEPPMTPADCDLRGMEWMPLYGGRLFGSDFDAHATDTEWRAAMQLWWSAWNQVPAASLPDDDVAMCRLAGLGRDLKAWRKIKARAIHGFVTCSDGRLYHRALADFAMESWARRLKDRERKAKWREQRERKTEQDRTRTETGTERGHDAGRDGDGDVPSQRDRTTDEMRRDATRRDSNASSEPNGSGGGPPGPAKQIFDQGIELLVGKGDCADAKAARSVIGKWRKTGTDQRVAALIREAMSDNISGPLEWITKALQRPDRDAPKPKATTAEEAIEQLKLDPGWQGRIPA